MRLSHCVDMHVREKRQERKHDSLCIDYLLQQNKPATVAFLVGTQVKQDLKGVKVSNYSMQQNVALFAGIQVRETSARAGKMQANQLGFPTRL